MRTIGILALALFSTTAFAQQTVEITEGGTNFTSGNHNTLSFIISNANLKDVSKAWAKELQGWKCRPKGKQELTSADCSTRSMGDRPFYVLSSVEEVPSQGVRVRAAFDLGGAYLSSAAHPDRYQAARQLLHAFAAEQTRVVIRAEIGAAQKLLAERQAAFTAAQRKEQQMKDEIAEREKLLEAAKKTQIDKLAELDAQRAVLTGLEEKLKTVK
jgi:hypothetical protein